MMDENKLTDKIMKASVQVANAIVLFILLSASTATDPFLRRMFGERYFTPARMFMSLIGWITVCLASMYPYSEHGKYPPWLMVVVANLIIWGYLAISFKHFRVIRKRQIAGELWHSRSRGETLFGDENPSRDLLIEIVITAALAFVLPYCAIFFALSRLLGYLAEYMAQVAFYNRYLDIRDGQIEAKYMETVLREGYPPHRTAGLFGPLPQRFKGQNRANIARVVAGQYADTLETPAANLPPSSSASEEARGIAPTLRVKRLVLVVIAAAGLVAGGWFIFHMWHTHRNEVVSAKTISSPAPIAAPVVQRQPSPPATPVVQTQPVETQPVTTVTPVVAPTPPPVDTAALAREALEKNRQEEQQRIAQQRQKAIDQFKSLVADKTAELAKLQTGSVGQLDDNTNKITKAAWLRRSRLTRENEKARTIISRELQNQQKALSVVRESVQLVSSDPSASPKDVAGNIDLYNQIAAEVGQRITAALKAMDDDISGNAPNSGLIQVR